MWCNTPPHILEILPFSDFILLSEWAEGNQKIKAKNPEW